MARMGEEIAQGFVLGKPEADSLKDLSRDVG